MNQAAIKKRAAEMRLRKLLRKGYFPAELPPPFTSKTFAASAVGFANKWDAAKIRGKFWTAPESYSIPRYGDARRKLALVNPINQLHIAQLIAENWTDIKARMARSKVTEFKPEFSILSGGRAITGVDFDGVARRRARLLSTYGRYVKTDITRFLRRFTHIQLHGRYLARRMRRLIIRRPRSGAISPTIWIRRLALAKRGKRWASPSALTPLGYWPS